MENYILTSPKNTGSIAKKKKKERVLPLPLKNAN